MKPSSKPTIILVSANAGYGHAKAGDDLAISLKTKLPTWAILHVNMCDYSARPQRWNIETVWQLFSTVPGLRTIYSFLHRRITSSDNLSKMASYAFRNIGNRLERTYRDTDVRAVIALHPGAAAACTQWKKHANFHLAVIATDLVVHGFHTLNHIDEIYADPRAIFSSKRALNAQRDHSVQHTGLPIEHSFFKKYSPSSSNASLKILVTFGAKGMRAKSSVKTILASLPNDHKIHVTFVCGKNGQLREYIREAAERVNLETQVTTLGFCNDMHILMSESDLILGKPGGITSGEILALNKQFVSLDHLPGQEEYNLQVLKRIGICRQISSKTELKKFLTAFIEQKDNFNLVPFRQPKNSGIEGIATSIASILTTNNLGTSEHDIPRPDQKYI